jgi:hypothetical protein
MADDKNFKELVKEMQDLNKSITKQNVERADSLNDLVNAQNKTTDMVTRRLTKAQTAQLDKDNEQMRVAKEESDRQAAADKKAQELENKKFTMKKFKDRVSNKLQKAPSALLGAARMATYNNRVMRNVAKGLKGISSGLGITGFAKAGLKTVWGTIKKLIQGGLLIGGIILLDKFFNSDVWPKVIDFFSEKLIPGIIGFGKWAVNNFGPVFMTALFGEGGTFKKPTGGLYGGFVGLVKIIGEIGKAMNEDDTGNKFANVIKSFFSLVFGVFGFGRDTVDANTGFKKGYFANIQERADKFRADLSTFFISLSRTFAKGIFGYEGSTDDKKFFKTMRDDLKLMFTNMIKGFSEAFYEQNPFIAKRLGINSAAKNRLLEFREKNPAIGRAVASMTADGTSTDLRDYMENLTPEGRAKFTEYMNLLNRASQTGEKLPAYADAFGTDIKQAPARLQVRALNIALGTETEDDREKFRAFMQTPQGLEMLKNLKSAYTKEGFEGILKSLGSQNADEIEKLGSENNQVLKRKQIKEAMNEELFILEKRKELLNLSNKNTQKIDEKIERLIEAIGKFIENGSGMTVIEGATIDQSKGGDNIVVSRVATNGDGALLALSNSHG